MCLPSPWLLVCSRVLLTLQFIKPDNLWWRRCDFCAPLQRRRQQNNILYTSGGQTNNLIIRLLTANSIKPQRRTTRLTNTATRLTRVSWLQVFKTSRFGLFLCVKSLFHCVCWIWHQWKCILLASLILSTWQPSAAATLLITAHPTSKQTGSQVSLSCYHTDTYVQSLEQVCFLDWGNQFESLCNITNIYLVITTDMSQISLMESF